MELRLQVMARGPIFQGNGTQASRDFVGGVIRELLQLGEERLALVLRPRPSGVFLSVTQAKKGRVSTGNYRRNMYANTRMHGSSLGIISDGGVIYGPWLEGVGSRNATTRFKGYASFRRTAQWLVRQVDAVVKAHLAKLMGKLG